MCHVTSPIECFPCARSDRNAARHEIGIPARDRWNPHPLSQMAGASGKPRAVHGAFTADIEGLSAGLAGAAFVNPRISGVPFATMAVTALGLWASQFAPPYDPLV